MEHDLHFRRVGGQRLQRHSARYQERNLLLFGGEERVPDMRLHEVKSHQTRLDGLPAHHPTIGARIAMPFSPLRTWRPSLSQK
jgi:hypothetical protein